MRNPNSYSSKIVIVSLSFVILTSILWFSLFGTARVHGTSMAPTINTGNRIVFFRFKNPMREEVVLAKIAGRPGFAVKRVLGVSGDHIHKQGNAIWVNDSRVVDVFSSKPLDLIVAAGHVFLLGDNVDYSIDSREYGTVRITQIKGVVFARIESTFDISRISHR